VLAVTDVTRGLWKTARPIPALEALGHPEERPLAAVLIRENRARPRRRRLSLTSKLSRY